MVMALEINNSIVDSLDENPYPTPCNKKRDKLSLIPSQSVQGLTYIFWSFEMYNKND